MTTADRIKRAVRDNPYLKVSDIARNFNTSRCQVRRVLKREGLYDTLKRTPFFTVSTPKYRDVVDVEVVVADLHIPFHEKGAVSTVLGYAKSLKPNRFRVLGDLMDFKSLSFWDRKRDEDQLLTEVESARDALFQMKEMFGHVIFHKGNHEDRWNRHVTTGHLEDVDGNNIEELLMLDKLGVEFQDALSEREMYGQWPSHGKLFYLHGDEARVGFNGVNIARTMASRTHDNTIFGHFHKTQDYYETNPMTNTTIGAWSIGCLCDLHPKFCPINNWNHGFAVIYFYEDGTFHVENRKIIEGMIL